jgi:hypothetical protein
VVIPQNQHHISIETTHCVAKTILQKNLGYGKVECSSNFPSYIGIKPYTIGEILRKVAISKKHHIN